MNHLTLFSISNVMPKPEEFMSCDPCCRMQSGLITSYTEQRKYVPQLLLTLTALGDELILAEIINITTGRHTME